MPLVPTYALDDYEFYDELEGRRPERLRQRRSDVAQAQAETRRRGQEDFRRVRDFGGSYAEMEPGRVRRLGRDYDVLVGEGQDLPAPPTRGGQRHVVPQRQLAGTYEGSSQMVDAYVPSVAAQNRGVSTPQERRMYRRRLSGRGSARTLGSHRNLEQIRRDNPDWDGLEAGRQLRPDDPKYMERGDARFGNYQSEVARAAERVYQDTDEELRQLNRERAMLDRRLERIQARRNRRK